MAASNIDLIAGFDPTAYPSISGAQLLQIVDNGTPYTDKGLVVRTADVATVPDVPDASTTTKWKRYLWIRQSAAAAIIYVWNDNAASDVTLLKWQTVAQASIGVGTIVNSMIADNTIQGAKIVSLDYSKLSGTPIGLPPTGAAGGDLTGTYPNPSVGNAVITTAKINDAAVTTNKIANVSVTVGKLTPSGSASSLIRTNAGVTANEYYVPPLFIATAGATSLAGNALKALRCNIGATDLELVSPNTSSFGRILQQSLTLSAAMSFTNYTTSPGARPTLAAALTTSNLKLGFSAAAFTPLNAGSSVLVEVIANLAGIGGTTNAIAGLLDSRVSATAMQAAAVAQQNTASVPVQVVFKYSLASWDIVTATTFSLYYGSTNNQIALNSTDGSTAMFGGLPAIQSVIRITEYI